MTAAKRCAIYTRKSTTAGLEQEVNSLEVQRHACTDYAHVHGWQIVDKSYNDGGYTGATLERPAFQRLLIDAGLRQFDVVLVYKVDRLSRSLLDFARVLDRFDRLAMGFVSVTQNFSTNEAAGKLTLHLLMSFAEFERSMISERTRDKIVALRRSGRWSGGPLPFGYRSVNRELVPDEQLRRSFPDRWSIRRRQSSSDRPDRHFRTNSSRSRSICEPRPIAGSRSFLPATRHPALRYVRGVDEAALDTRLSLLQVQHPGETRQGSMSRSSSLRRRD